MDLESDAKAAEANAARLADSFGFQYLAGVVSRAQKPVLERQVYLSTRGNTFSLFSDVDGEDKVVFILFFLGNALRRKLSKVCDALSVSLYLYPENSGDVKKQKTLNDAQIAELSRVLEFTEKVRSQLPYSLVCCIVLYMFLYVLFLFMV
jgi:hypothetical protein